MYVSITEMISDIEAESLKDKQIKLIKSYTLKYPQFKYFLRYAFFNNLNSCFTKIPDYKTNMVDITFSYVKLEKALSSIKFFFEGPDMIVGAKKREDRLVSLLQEMSWLETPVFEMLVLNNFKNSVLTKELVIEALPEMEDRKNVKA
jgi:hypothetical protein